MKRNAFDSVTVQFAMTNMYRINVHTTLFSAFSRLFSSQNYTYFWQISFHVCPMSDYLNLTHFSVSFTFQIL